MKFVLRFFAYYEFRGISTDYDIRTAIDIQSSHKLFDLIESGSAARLCISRLFIRIYVLFWGKGIPEWPMGFISP